MIFVFSVFTFNAYVLKWSLKELKTTNKVGEKSWLYSDKPGERVDSESAVMGKKIAKLIVLKSIV